MFLNLESISPIGEKGKICKKSHTKLRKGGAAVLLLLGAFLVASRPAVVYASQTTQDKLDRAKEAAGQTQDAISSNNEAIDQLQDSRDDITSKISSLNSQIASISQEINNLDGQISDKQDEIDETGERLEDIIQELNEAEQKQKQQYEEMKNRIRFIYERGNTYYLEILFSSRSFSELLNYERYIKQMSAYDKQKLEEYKEAAAGIKEKKQEIEEQQAELEAQKSELEGLSQNKAAKKSQVSSIVVSAKGSLDLTDAQLADANAISDALKEQLDQQNQEITALQKQLEEERRLQQISDAGVWRDISQVSFDEGDRYLLANLIYCEAGNQPYSGQVAVGAVVMNRVLSPAFPNTVSGVIYQSGQFEPAFTGRLALALAEDRATDACYQAADAAMGGQTTVSTCLFFRTPIPEVEPKYTIGGHIFY